MKAARGMIPAMNRARGEGKGGSMDGNTNKEGKGD